jgi:hypothetical protein
MHAVDMRTLAAFPTYDYSLVRLNPRRSLKIDSCMVTHIQTSMPREGGPVIAHSHSSLRMRSNVVASAAQYLCSPGKVL